MHYIYQLARHNSYRDGEENISVRMNKRGRVAEQRHQASLVTGGGDQAEGGGGGPARLCRSPSLSGEHSRSSSLYFSTLRAAYAAYMIGKHINALAAMLPAAAASRKIAASGRNEKRRYRRRRQAEKSEEGGRRSHIVLWHHDADRNSDSYVQINTPSLISAEKKKKETLEKTKGE